LRIVGTYAALSETVDEVAHVGVGMEWLGRGTYTFELQHPPLARIAAAVGPYLLGARFQDKPSFWDEGRQALYANHAYLRNLTAARLGILVFFPIACFFLWRLGALAFGQSVALGAVACFTLLPPVLAHYGLATTDGPMLAMFAAAIFGLVRWLQGPNVRTGIGLGAACALAVVTKFSSIPFLGATGVLVLLGVIWADRSRSGDTTGRESDLAVRSPSPWPWKAAAVSAVVGACVGLLVAWSVYRFSIDTVRGIPLPLVEIPKGILEVMDHNRLGHPAYFLGQSRMHGVWYFFPVVLLLKTPISVLLLAALGIGLLVARGIKTRDWVPFVPVAVPVAILAVSMPTGLNLGVRHVLPAYLGIALAVGVAWVWLWQRFSTRAARLTVVALTTFLSAGTVRAHPDYLSYFNELAGDDPSELVADSDVDWGQDLFRLRDSLRTRNVDTLHFAYIGTADLSPIVGVPVKYWNGTGRPTGWVAVTETLYRRGLLSWVGDRYVIDQNALKWLDSVAMPVRVGKGIRVYRIQ
jgi:4-amino-4-deoxy-L-arabinose transferase-like glycosyltransferase